MNATIEGFGLQPAAPPRTFAQRFVETNGFYVLSALLMILGCYLVMRTGNVEVSNLDHTLRALLILQCYEMLVILTAAGIARRFARLGDAVTLLVIELALLLDPTFFSNAFFTLQAPAAATVNALCLLLVPLKLAFLLKALRLRVSPPMLAALLASAAFVYLGEGPLSLDLLPFSHAVYYLILAWALLGIALIAPPLWRVLLVPAAPEGRLTAGQRAWLPRIFLLIALAEPALHFVQSARVHQIPTYYFFGGPLLLALAVLIVKNTPAARRTAALAAMDVMTLGAIALSFVPTSVEGQLVHHAVTDLPPAFASWNLALFTCLAASALLYGVYAKRFGATQAAWRVAALTAFAGVMVLHETGILGEMLRSLANTSAETAAVLVNLPMAVWMFTFGLAFFAVGIVVTYLKERHPAPLGPSGPIPADAFFTPSEPSGPDTPTEPDDPFNPGS